MKYEELEAKQTAEWKEFYFQKAQANTNLVEKHHEACKPYHDANQEIPSKLSKQIQKEHDDWTSEWSNKGTRAIALNEAHLIERKEWAKANPLEKHMAEVKRGKIFER